MFLYFSVYSWVKYIDYRATFQRYTIKDCDYYTFIYRLEKMIRNDTNMLKTYKRGYYPYPIEQTGTPHFVSKEHAKIRGSNANTFISFYLKKANLLAAVFVQKETDPLIVDFMPMMGVDSISQNGRMHPLSDYGSFFERKSFEELRYDFKICRLFEKEILSKISEYKMDLINTIFLLCGFLLNEYFKTYILILLFLLYALYDSRYR